MENEGNGDTSCGWCTRNNPKGNSKGTRRHGNKRTSRDYPDYSIIKIGQNTEKSPGGLRKVAVGQTLSENRQLMLVWKSLIILLMKSRQRINGWLEIIKKGQGNQIIKRSTSIRTENNKSYGTGMWL